VKERKKKKDQVGGARNGTKKELKDKNGWANVIPMNFLKTSADVLKNK